MDGWRFHVFLEKQDKEGQHGLYETWGGGALTGITRTSKKDEKIAKGRQKRGVPF